MLGMEEKGEITLDVDVCSIGKSCPTVYDPMDYSRPGSSVHGISQARILERVAFLSPENLPDPRIEPASPAMQVHSLPLSHLGSLFLDKQINVWN